MKPKKIPYEEFKAIYSKVPRFCVDLIIKNSKGILLTKRDIPPKRGWWHFPGGTVLFNETVEQAIQRVAQEELNTKVKIKKLLGLWEYTQGSGLGYPIAAEFLVEPLGKIKGGEQAKEVEVFKSLPPKTMLEVKRYLYKQFKMR